MRRNFESSFFRNSKQVSLFCQIISDHCYKSHTFIHIKNIRPTVFLRLILMAPPSTLSFEPGLLEFFTQRSELKEGLLVTTHFK